MTRGINENIGFRPTGNPEADAQTYAKAHGISVDEAKAQLRAKFGNPQQQLMPQMFGSNNQVWTGGMGTPLPMIPRMGTVQPFTFVGQSPEQLTAYVSNFATANSISEKYAARLLGLPDRDAVRPAGNNNNQTGEVTQEKTPADYTKREIKRIQKAYEKDIKKFVKAHKKEYKAKYSDKRERMIKLYDAAEAYAENKWKEANPNLEFPKSRFREFTYSGV